MSCTQFSSPTWSDPNRISVFSDLYFTILPFTIAIFSSITGLFSFITMPLSIKVLK
eukprot:m.496014 g.496014  ORF g.496014 m.496014 type:complete len:56 (+) comp144982_c0_seq1:128-295(+)